MYYIMPESFIRQLAIRNIRFKAHEQDSEQPEPKQPVITKKRYSPTEVSSTVFWYVFIDRLMKLKKRKDFITIIADDSNQIFSEDSRGEAWHMIEQFVSSIVDMRRLNISLILSVHEMSLMYYKVRRRADYMIYMKGARPDDKASRVSWPLVSALRIGQYIVEDPGVSFGLCEFEKLENQPEVINVIGCENFA